MINVWLDDFRDPGAFAPGISWNWVKSYDEFVAFMTQNTNITWVSFDHDLDFINGEKNGAHCMEWMFTNNIFPQLISLHTSNPVGRFNMENMIDRTERYSKSGLITYSLL